MRTRTRVVAAAAAGVVGLTLVMPAATAEPEPGQRTNSKTTRSAGDCPDVTRPDDGTRDTKPVIWTTEAMIGKAKQRVADRQEPFYTSWVKTRQHADQALELADDLEAYQGPNEYTYFMRGREHAKFARSLALAYRITGEKRYLDGVRQLLSDWARDAIEYPYPDPPKGFAAWPASSLPHGSGLRIGRVISTFGDAYAMVWAYLPEAERADVEDWMRLMVDPICETQRIWRQDPYQQWEPPYIDQQYFNNHLTAQTLGLTTVGHVTGDEAIIRHAIDDEANKRNLRVLVDGVIVMAGDRLYKKDPTLTDDMPDPKSGEIYDRYRTRGGKGIFYTLTNLRFLVLALEMAHNNDEPINWEYVAPGGENPEKSFQVYSPWYITGRADSVNGAYYAAEQASGMPRIVDELSSWELARTRYPDNEPIRKALSAGERLNFDDETWGWSAPLTHGLLTE